MSEITIELNVGGAAGEVAFVQAIDKFARWREVSRGMGWQDRDAPDLMVKTICAADGRLNKAITFQDSRWATTFMKFWKSELHEYKAQAPNAKQS